MEEKKVDRRVRKTKRQLRLALTKLLQEKPIKDITVREIADMVDINRGTFYLHYKDVYDMLEQVEAEMFEEFNQILNAQPSIVNAENPYPILNDIFHFFINYSDMAIALLGPNGDHAFVNRLKAIVKDKCFQEITAAYEGAHSERFEYFYEFIVYGCIGLFQRWLETGMKEPPEEMARLAQLIISCGGQALK